MAWIWRRIIISFKISRRVRISVWVRMFDTLPGHSTKCRIWLFASAITSISSFGVRVLNFIFGYCSCHWQSSKFDFPACCRILWNRKVKSTGCCSSAWWDTWTQPWLKVSIAWIKVCLRLHRLLHLPQHPAGQYPCLHRADLSPCRPRVEPSPCLPQAGRQAQRNKRRLHGCTL